MVMKMQKVTNLSDIQRITWLYGKSDLQGRLTMFLPVGIRTTWSLRKLNNVPPNWYVEEGGTFCSLCSLAYDFDDSYKALQLGRAKGQERGPRCIRCGKILRARSKPNPKSRFWSKVDEVENGK